MFHIYHLIAHCTLHGRRSLDKNKICCFCLQYLATVSPAKIYTRKELFMMDTSIYDFHTSFYIPKMQKVAFHSPTGTYTRA